MMKFFEEDAGKGLDRINRMDRMVKHLWHKGMRLFGFSIGPVYAGKDLDQQDAEEPLPSYLYDL